MKLKRFLRDFAVLAGFCGAFYLLTVAMSRLDKEPEGDSDFSAVRKRADVSITDRDWESASVDYLKLAEQDPYNGHAWYRCATSFNAQRNELFHQLQGARADAKEAQAELNATSPETEELIMSLQTELDRLGGEAKNAFAKAKEFARYRADSLLNLAAIESYEGNNSDSLEHLDQFVDNGSYTSRGLSHYRVFGVGGPQSASPLGQPNSVQVRLHAEPKFWEIVRKEGFNQSR